MVHFTVISALFTLRHVPKYPKLPLNQVVTFSSDLIILSDRRCVLHSLVSMHKDSIGYEVQNLYPRYFAASDTEPSTAKIRSNRACIPCS